MWVVTNKNWQFSCIFFVSNLTTFLLVLNIKKDVFWTVSAMIFLSMLSILYLNIYPILGGTAGRDYYLAEMDNKELHLLEVQDLQHEKEEQPTIQEEEDPVIPSDTPLQKEKESKIFNKRLSNSS